MKKMKLKIRECCCCCLELTADCQSKANSAAAAVFAATATRPAELHWQIAQYEHTKDYKSLCKRTNCSERYAHRGHLSSLDVCHFLLARSHLSLLFAFATTAIDLHPLRGLVLHFVRLYSLLYSVRFYSQAQTRTQSFSLSLSVNGPTNSVHFCSLSFFIVCIRPRAFSHSLTRWLLFSSFLLWPIIPLLDSTLSLSHCHKQPVNDTDCAVLAEVN